MFIAPMTGQSASSRPEKAVSRRIYPLATLCQILIVAAEINAAKTIESLVASPTFNLEKTYFMIAGIGGVSPERATLGSVTLAKYAVQVALQYEFDAREIPANFSTGYVPFGTKAPGQYPHNIYGTEVFELNEALRDMVCRVAPMLASTEK